MKYIKQLVSPFRFDASWLSWAISIFVVLIQQDAFVTTPLLLGDISGFELREIRNPFNTFGICASIVFIGICSLRYLKQLAALALNNRVSLLYMVIVIVSVTWSIHPDLTLRRGIGYVLTILIAAYISIRFSAVDRMKVLSGSFTVSAIGSLIFIAIFPQYGIMQDGDVAGDWRGVFPHKNVMGPVMAVAVFVEVYMLAAGRGHPIWRWFLLITYFVLVVLSHSATALLLSLAFLVLAFIYLVWQRNRLIGGSLSILTGLLLLTALISLWSDPKFTLSVLGKDTSLTGRTELWYAVIPLIKQRLVLGWGYRAMWQSTDAYAVMIDQIAGWGATSSHNTFLEITLQLGLVGAGIMLAIVLIAIWRSIQCCHAGIIPLGWFSLMFFIGAVIAGLTMETLGKNQTIEWLVFNVLSFSCGIGLSSHCQSALFNGRRYIIRRLNQAPQRR